MTEPRATFVLPAFNEGSRIASSLATLDAWFGSAADMLVVDDGSDDDTFAEAARCAERQPRIRVHRLPRHRGKGAAVRSAVPLLRTERVVFLDADIAFDRDSIQRALDALDAAEMAIGNRRHHDSHYSVPVRLFGFLYRRHLVGLVFNAFVRALLGLRFRDTQCGLKAFRRSSLERIAPALTVDGFALDVEVLLVATALDVRLTEIPVNVRYETAKSSVKLLLSGWAMAADLLTIAWRRARGGYAPARLAALSPKADVTGP